MQELSKKKSILGIFSKKIKPKSVTLSKPAGMCLIGSQTTRDAIFVQGLSWGGAADQSGAIRPGLRLQYINGTNTEQMRLRLSNLDNFECCLTFCVTVEAISLLETAPPTFTVVVIDDSRAYKAFCKEHNVRAK